MITFPPEHYRYRLTRDWLVGQGKVCWVMLNPSTADQTQDDATIRRCCRFSQAWGKAGLVVVNLFAYRTTWPKMLVNLARSEHDVVGAENDKAITEAAAEADLVVAAWGENGHHVSPERVQAVVDLLAPYHIHCLGTTASGAPRHPVRLSKETQLRLWRYQGTVTMKVRTE